MKCIIYGLSTARQFIEKNLYEYIDIIGYSDSFHNLLEYNFKRFYKPKELVNLSFDLLIIAIDGDKDNIEVKEKLMDLGICEKKIITMYEYKKYYFKELKKSNEIINFDLESDLNGLIFGISYAQAGIIPRYIDKGVYNLALGSQDIFYNYHQLKRIIEKYKEKILNIKFVILDMYTYTYFNYDLSLSKNAISFIYNNGFEHITNNFIYNKNFSEEEISEIKKELSIDKMKLLEEIIDSKKIIRRDRTYFFNKEERDKRIDEVELSNYKNKKSYGLSNIEKNIYSETEEMNIKIFKKFLHDIKEINKDIKIYTVLIPRYKLVEEANKENKKIWKDRFYKIIEECQKEYDFDFIDLKDCEQIKDNMNYYFDLEHLNYQGAIEFTKVLKQYLN